MPCPIPSAFLCMPAPLSLKTMTKQEGFGRPGVLRADSNASDPVFNFGMPARYGESAQGYVVAKALSLALADPIK